MAIVGRLHPLLVHFPIALVISAAAVDALAAVTSSDRWRVLAAANMRIGAAFTVLAVIAGWRFAGGGGDTTALLEWHRWLGTIAAGAAVAAALAPSRAQSAAGVWMHRIAFVAAALLVAAAGHLGGLLVWGDSFLHL
jgi:uncharacterized membrane protein